MGAMGSRDRQVLLAIQDENLEWLERGHRFLLNCAGGAFVLIAFVRGHSHFLPYGGCIHLLG